MVNNQSRTPYYDLQQIKSYVLGEQFEFVTPGASKDYKELGWTTREFIAIVQALDKTRHFHRTHINMSTDIGPLTVDAYRISFNEEELREDRRDGIEFYLKLAIDPDQPGTAVVSVHLSRNI